MRGDVLPAGVNLSRKIVPPATGGVSSGYVSAQRIVLASPAAITVRFFAVGSLAICRKPIGDNLFAQP